MAYKIKHNGRNYNKSSFKKHIEKHHQKDWIEKWYSDLTQYSRNPYL